MDKYQVLKVFNDKIYEFVTDLLVIYPNDEDLYAFKKGLRLIWIVDDRKTIRIFKKFILDNYKNELITRNETFFLEHSFESEINNYNREETDFSMQLMNRLKFYWKNLTCENKKTIYNYFDVLILLCENYFQ